MPFSCSTLKFSVTTRCPLTKTPNAPESTFCGPFCPGLSFLSPACNKAAQAKTTVAPHRIRPVRFTAFHPVFRGFVLNLDLILDPGPELEPPRPQSLRSFSRWSLAAALPSYNAAAAPREDCENFPGYPATDAQFLAACGSAATIPLRPYPRTLSRRSQPRSNARSAPAQKPHRQVRLLSQPRRSTHRTIPSTPHVPRGETQ